MPRLVNKNKVKKPQTILTIQPSFQPSTRDVACVICKARIKYLTSYRICDKGSRGEDDEVVVGGGETMMMIMIMQSGVGSECPRCMWSSASKSTPAGGFRLESIFHVSTTTRYRLTLPDPRYFSSLL